MENFNIIIYIFLVISLDSLCSSLEGFCYGVTGKMPLAHLNAYRAEKRRERAIAREERRKAREDKKNAC